MFRTVALSIIRSFSPYTQQWYVSYRCADSLLAGSGQNYILILLASCQHTCMTYTIAVCTVKTDDGKRNCPKHVEFYSKNKFEKLVHLVGFIVWIYHDARSPERQTVFHLYSRCKLTPAMKIEQSVPKRRHIKFRRREITQMNDYNNPTSPNLT